MLVRAIPGHGETVGDAHRALLRVSIGMEDDSGRQMNFCPPGLSADAVLSRARAGSGPFGSITLRPATLAEKALAPYSAVLMQSRILLLMSRIFHTVAAAAPPKATAPTIVSEVATANSSSSRAITARSMATTSSPATESASLKVDSATLLYSADNSRSFVSAPCSAVLMACRSRRLAPAALPVQANWESTCPLR